MLNIFNPPKSPRVPRSFFVSAAHAVLGKRYELSLAFVPAREMRRLNRRYRGKDAPTDILSFPFSKSGGEIVFCLTEARAQARRFERAAEHFLKFLFIHGLLHLKGYGHGRRMEREEEKIRRKFGI